MTTCSYDILIADAGSTKTDWACISSSSLEVRYFRTQGINAVHTPANEIRECLEVAKEKTGDSSPIRRIHFFGAGCASPLFCSGIKDLLLEKWSEALIEVGSDLVGAAISLLGDRDGIACILGTGANSGLWMDSQIIANTPPLGYILGDEGSGASLGKRLINSVFKGELPKEIRKSFEEETGLSLNDIISNVYRRNQPARFLASMAPFLKRHLDNDRIRKLVIDEFELFFRRNVINYEGCQSLPVALTGSIAWHFKDEIILAGHHCDLNITRITQAPMEGLKEYYKSAKR